MFYVELFSIIKMKEFKDYDIHYQELILDILEYFNISNGINGRSVSEFCHLNTPSGESFLSPNIITKICEILCDNNYMSRVSSGGVAGINNNYLNTADLKAFTSDKERNLHFFNSVVYGFEYIYKFYEDKVIPIIAYKEDGTPMIGSCFKFHNGIVTARHCLEDGRSVSIPGYSQEVLSKAKIYVSKNPAVDIAYIDINQKAIQVFIEEPHVLDEILVMGYPMIPRFLQFFTVEKATISSIAKVRFATSRGAITSIADEMFTKDITQLMLITARITGGNSGGPIINKQGSIVGIAISDAKAEGEGYDNLGYGIAIPISVTLMNKIIEEKYTIDVHFENFKDVS